jgi:hypothetical protein
MRTNPIEGPILFMVVTPLDGIAQNLQDALMAATGADQIQALPVDPAATRSSWWVTVSPFINKGDFHR